MMKAMWMAGDFGKIAELMQPAAEEFVARLQLKPGMRVLDVGSGDRQSEHPGGAHRRLGDLC